MGFSYRKSVKIAPGIRMNVSKSGIGFSAGVKGARISTGPRGTRLTTSIPGTGISYQTKLSSKKKRPSRSTQQDYARRQRERELARVEKELDKQYEMEQNQIKIDEHENYLDLIRSIHKEYSEPINWIAVFEGKYLSKIINQNEVAALDEVKNFNPSWRDKLFGRADAKRNQLEDLVEEAKKQDIELIRIAKQKQELAKRIIYYDLAAYEEVLEEEIPFDDIFELGAEINYDIHSPKSMSYEIDVKSKDTVPTTKLSLTTTGKLSERKMTKTQYFDIYQDYICSIALRLGRDTFNLLPLDEVYVHVADQVEIEGKVSTGTVISVKFTRNEFKKIDFETCDCSDTIETFEHVMNFKKTKGLNIVTKLSEGN